MRHEHSWIPSISSCLSLSPASSKCFLSTRLFAQTAISPPTPQCLGVKYAGLKIFIHFIQTTAQKKILFLDQEKQTFSLGPFLGFLRRDSLGLLSNLARTGNACNLSCQNVSHALQFRSKHISLAEVSEFADNTVDLMFFPKAFFSQLTLHKYSMQNAHCCKAECFMDALNISQ